MTNPSEKEEYLKELFTLLAAAYEQRNITKTVGGGKVTFTFTLDKAKTEAAVYAGGLGSAG